MARPKKTPQIEPQEAATPHKAVNKGGRPRTKPVLVKETGKIYTTRGTELMCPDRIPKKTSVAKLLKQKALNPDLSIRELAEINNVSKQAVSQMFKRYGIDETYLAKFKEHRADLFAGIQETVLSTLTSDDIKKASVRDRTILAGTLYDKERLERGQSTSNSSVFFQIVAESDQAD